MTDMEALRSACEQAEVRSGAEKIAAGEPLWLSGLAAKSEKGTIALAIDDLTLVVCDADVQGVSRHGENFRVQVRAGTEMLVRLERVTQVRSAVACDCAKPETREVSRRGIVLGPVTVCSTFEVCFLILGVRYCYNIPYDCHIEGAQPS